MLKEPIGFLAENDESKIVDAVLKELQKTKEPKKSKVKVYFPTRHASYSYYNDKFDLNVGDYVYVEGKLEGLRGQVTEVCHSFKIKISDYKKVIAKVDTDIKGEFYFADSYVVAFSSDVLPPEKITTWFKAPSDEEDIVCVSGDDEGFLLSDLYEMKMNSEISQRGYDYYMKNKVRYICLDGNKGYAIVEGTEPYEVEFLYEDGKIYNLVCPCMCEYRCKHEFATMLQLKETLNYITENYSDKYTGYFVALSKDIFVDVVMNKRGNIKIGIGV